MMKKEEKENFIRFKSMLIKKNSYKNVFWGHSKRTSVPSTGGVAEKRTKVDTRVWGEGLMGFGRSLK